MSHVEKCRRPELTADRVREVLEYDLESGNFRWRRPTGPKGKNGGLAGCFDKSTGYWRMHIDGVNYLCHRVAWLYVHGEWPKQVIDHKNGDRKDNRFGNLRNVTHQENCENRRMASWRSSSGYLGVSTNESHKGPLKYRAMISHNDELIVLGRFRTPEEAAAAYHGAKCVLHRGFLPGPSVE